MASLDRAYGLRGVVIALGMAAVAGGVHGVLSWSLDSIWTKIGFGIAASIVMIMAGAISARRTLPIAIALGLGMGLAFFMTRWSLWSLMDGGFALTGQFLVTAPWAWAGFLADRGISGYWVVEMISLTVPAVFGTIVGQERTA